METCADLVIRDDFDIWNLKMYYGGVIVHAVSCETKRCKILVLFCTSLFYKRRPFCFRTNYVVDMCA